MIEMTVTYKGLSRSKLIHWVTVIFLLTNNNRMGKATAPEGLSAAALGSHFAIIIGMKMKKFGFDCITKRCPAFHGRKQKQIKTFVFTVSNQ